MSDPHALAKLAEIPTAGSEEREFWLEAAEQHGVVPQTTRLRSFQDSEDAILTLMSEARKQGQRDALAAIGEPKLDPRVDAQVWMAAHALQPVQLDRPEWLWWDDLVITFGRWPERGTQAPYVRADIALGIGAALATGGARHG